MSIWKRLFGTAKKEPPTLVVDVPREVPPLSLAWQSDTTMPIVDWAQAWQTAPASRSASDLAQHWSQVALTWLDALRTQLPGKYRVARSESFTVLSTLDDRQLQLTLDFCERSRRRILRDLEGIARSWGNGPHVLLLFEDFDSYDLYISNYYPKDGDFNVPAGVFLNRGYGHFVLVSRDLDRMERIIAHELTHCLMASLKLPTWLNEGAAVNMEEVIIPGRSDPRRGIYALQEMADKRAKFWNSETIQEFWSGQSFHRTDEGCGLSYELAKQLTRLVARDYPKYREFMNSALRADGGEAAATSILGFSLADLAGAVLGEGEWSPKPELWVHALDARE